MKIIFIILLISSITSKELVFDISVFKDFDISLVDNSVENQSEQENQDTSEDESKIDFFSHNLFCNSFLGAFYNSTHRLISLLKRTPYLEIHSPPPE
jgi:hypothetical protein